MSLPGNGRSHKHHHVWYSNCLVTEEITRSDPGNNARRHFKERLHKWVWKRMLDLFYTDKEKGWIDSWEQPGGEPHESWLTWGCCPISSLIREKNRTTDSVGRTRYYPTLQILKMGNKQFGKFLNPRKSPRSACSGLSLNLFVQMNKHRQFILSILYTFGSMELHSKGL